MQLHQVDCYYSSNGLKVGVHRLIEEEQYFTQGSVLDKIFPSNFELVPNTHELFAVELAHGEYVSLSKKELITRSGFFARIDDKPTLHYKLCSGTPLEEIRAGKTIWVKSFFQANRFSTGYATHSLFPYRGKFHPQLIKGIFNVTQVQEGDTVLDPMVGSGTTCVEARLMNFKSIGVDINPFCILISQAKSVGLNIDIEQFAELGDDESLLAQLQDLSGQASNYDTIHSFLSAIKITKDVRTDSVLLLSFLDAMGYARRRKTGSLKELFSKVLERYITTITSFQKNREALKIKLGSSDMHTGDALSLNIPDRSVDMIVTSPPYSFAIDYVENDRPQLEFLGIDVDKLKSQTIGLQGKTKREKITNYFNTMNQAIREMSRVLKPDKFCVIIVGSNEIQTGGIRHEQEFKAFADQHDLVLRKELVKSIQGIRNSMREEYVLFFQKQS